MQETIQKEQAMQKIMIKAPPACTRSGTARYAAIAQAMRVPVWSVGLYLNKLRSYSLSMDTRKLSLTSQITRLIKQVSFPLPSKH
jgi:hypothetical protein